MPKVAPERHHRIDTVADKLITAGAGHPDDLLTTSHMMEWFDVSLQWFEIGRSMGYGPPFIQLAPRTVRYKRSHVLAWLEQRKHKSTAEYLPRRKRRVRS